MAERKLTKVFNLDNLTLELQASAGDGWSDLGAMVGGTASSGPLSASFGGTAKGIKLLGRSVEAGANLAASFSLLGADAAGVELPTGEPYQTPPGLNVIELRLDGRAGASADTGDLPVGPAALSASLSGSGQLSYRHLLPVQVSETVGSALGRVAKASRSPNLVRANALAVGELHHLSGKVALELGVEAGFAKKVKLTSGEWLIGQLFADVPPLVKLDAELSARAALGLALYDEMEVLVARTATLRPGRVRIRIARKKERRLSLSARVALLARYDAAGGLQSLLEHLLDAAPLPVAVERLRDVVRMTASEDWSELIGVVDREVGDFLDEFLEGAPWATWVRGSSEVGRLVEFARRVVAEYDALDERVQGWWDDLASSAGLGTDSPARAVLAKLQSLDPDHLDLLELLEKKGEWGKHADLIEKLAGESIEDLILRGSPGAKPVLERVAAAATRGAEFLAGEPDVLKDRLHRYLERTGIGATATWLRANAVSRDALLASMNKRLRAFVSRLLDRAWESISDADAERVRGWAAKVEAALDAPGEWVTRLQGDLDRLRGEAAYSVALEMQRRSSFEALLDLELNPSDSGAWAALSGPLASLDLRSLLDALVGLSGDPDDDDAEPPFLLRECAFVSSRVSSGSLVEALRLFGIDRLLTRESVRTARSTVRVTQPDPSSAVLRRTGFHEGVFTRVVRSGDSLQFRCDVRLELEGAVSVAAGSVLGVGYPAVSSRLRLSLLREDAALRDSDVVGLVQLLSELGFRGAAGDPTLPDEAVGKPYRFLVEIVLPPSAPKALLGGGDVRARWSEAYRTALTRWFVEGLVDNRGAFGNDHGVTDGQVLAAVMNLKKVRDAWGSDDIAFTDAARAALGTNGTVTVAGRKIKAGPLVARPSNRWELRAIPVPEANRRCRDSEHAAVALAEKLDSADGDEALWRSAWAFARTMSKAHGRLWPNPMLDFWLVLARIGGTTASPQTTGLASFRYRPDESVQWREATIFRLGG